MKKFFDRIRPLFRGGKLSDTQVRGITEIIRYGIKWRYRRADIAAVLGTAFHETGQRMQPVREGFCDTDAGSRRAVTRLWERGKIKTNYSLPNKAGQSFYGRGLVQITWEENYRKMEEVTGLPLVSNPDLALQMVASVKIIYTGMRDGMFRKGNRLSMLPPFPSYIQWVASRGIINGDMTKNGGMIARYCMHFFDALSSVDLTLHSVGLEEPFVEPELPDLVVLDDYIKPKETSLWQQLSRWVLARFGA